MLGHMGKVPRTGKNPAPLCPALPDGAASHLSTPCPEKPPPRLPTMGGLGNYHITAAPHLPMQAAPPSQGSSHPLQRSHCIACLSFLGCHVQGSNVAFPQSHPSLGCLGHTWDTAHGWQTRVPEPSTCTSLALRFLAPAWGASPLGPRELPPQARPPWGPPACRPLTMQCLPPELPPVPTAAHLLSSDAISSTTLLTG